MKTIASLFKKLSFSSDEDIKEPVVNPSEILRVHQKDITGTLEIRSLDTEDDNPSNILRVSWIRRDDIKGRLKTVWVNEEMEVL